MGEKVQYQSGTTVQVYSYEQGVPGKDSFNQPDAGNEFAVIDAEVCAGSSTTASYNPLGFHLQTPDNRRYDSSFNDARDPRLSSGDIPPNGGCVRGWASFEVPIGQRPSWVVWDYGGYSPAKWDVPA
jgi:hypothetical protein